jgi:hypothetical protein
MVLKSSTQKEEKKRPYILYWWMYMYLNRSYWESDQSIISCIIWHYDDTIVSIIYIYYDIAKICPKAINLFLRSLLLDNRTIYMLFKQYKYIVLHLNFRQNKINKKISMNFYIFQNCSIWFPLMFNFYFYLS